MDQHVGRSLGPGGRPWHVQVLCIGHRGSKHARLRTWHSALVTRAPRAHRTVMYSDLVASASCLCLALSRLCARGRGSARLRVMWSRDRWFRRGGLCAALCMRASVVWRERVRVVASRRPLHSPPPRTSLPTPGILAGANITDAMSHFVLQALRTPGALL